MTNDTHPYQPVSCAEHSHLKLAILRQRYLLFRWQDKDHSEQRQELLPLDLLTQNGEEYLLAQDINGRSYRIRLDQIIHYPKELSNGN